jgi:DNA-binding protein YbaB
VYVDPAQSIDENHDMADDVPTSLHGLTSVLDDTRRMLDAMRARRGQPEPESEPVQDRAAEELRGRGEAAGGRVRAVLTRDRIEELHLDPRLLRQGSEALGEFLVSALNEALADLAAKETADAPDSAGDPDVLAERLRQLQDESMRNMDLITQSVADVLSRLRQGRGGAT